MPTIFERIHSWIGGLAPDSKTKGNLLMSNYTETMIARLNAEAPLDLAKAQALSAEFGNVTHRSVSSKAKSLGLEYVKAQPARKAKTDEPTKADILRGIRLATALPDREGDLTKAELSTILMAIA
jgi:transposase